MFYGLLFVVFCFRLSGKVVDFQGSDQVSGGIGVQLSGLFWIEFFELLVEESVLLRLLLLELLSECEIGRAFGHREIFVDGVDIESCSACDKGDFPCSHDLFYDGLCVFFSLPGGIGFVGVDDIDLVMRDFCSDFFTDFICSNIHQSKNLSAICRDDLGREGFAEEHGEFTFACGGGSSDDDGSFLVGIQKLFKFLFGILKDFFYFHGCIY